MIAGPRARLAAAAIVAAAVLLLARPVTLVTVENTDRGREAEFMLASGAMLSVTYHHSMYDREVTESFRVADGGLVLTALDSGSAAVREYFGVTAAGDRHAMDRRLPEIVFRVAAGTPQRLAIDGAERSFLEFGDHGDRLRMGARETPVALWLAGRLVAWF